MQVIPVDVRIIAPYTAVVVVPQGATAILLKGPPGSSGASGTEISITAAVSGAVTISLPASPAPVSVNQVFVNGLRQGLTDVSLAGATVTLSAALNIVAGDLINLSYSTA
jgi:hypothetical protein